MSTIDCLTRSPYAAYEAPRAEFGRCARSLFVGFAAALIIIVYIAPIAESWKCSTYVGYNAGADDIEVSVRKGNMTRQIALGSLGLFGLVTIGWPGGKVIRLRGTLGVLCVAYLAWCAATCLWSDDPGLSLKRWIALMCELLGAMAIAKRCSVSQFVWIVFSCALAWLALGIVAELSHGTFRPWQQGYRFSGIFHPNEMGANCAILTLSASYLAAVARRRKRILWAVAALGFVFLFLTGSRTALATAVVAMAALWVLMAPIEKALWRLMAGGMAAACVSVAQALGSFKDLSGFVAMGREENSVSTFEGRLPLWNLLLQKYAHRQPLVGHGYGAFWNTDHILDVSSSQGWTVGSAHSTYIDLLLNVGYIGGALYLSAMVLAVIYFCRLEARHPRIGYGFMAILVIFALGAGLLETTINVASFLSFFSVCGVCYLMVDDVDTVVPTFSDCEERCP